MKRLEPPREDRTDKAKKARSIDESSGSSGKLRDESEASIIVLCEEEAITASPLLTVGSGVLFYKAIPTMPAPTPTALRVGVDIRNGDYTGDAQLSVAGPGKVEVYTTDTCAVLYVAELSATVPMTVSNADLKAGRPFFLRGTWQGQMNLTLTLAPEPGVGILGTNTQTTAVVEVSILPHRRQREGSMLPNSLRYVHGHLLPIPAIATKPRARLDVTADLPGSTVMLNIATACVHLHSHRTNDTANGMGVPGVVPFSYWAEGSAANAPTLVEASLLLADGTVLHNGDHVCYEPVVQSPISMGLEWEIPTFKVEARHKELTATDNAETLMDEDEWMNAPSKSVVFSSENAAVMDRMKIAVEMALKSFGEFVLGPFYSYGTLEPALGEIKRVVDFVNHHRAVVSRNHPAMKSTNEGEFGDVWAVADSKITLSNPTRNWTGTAQASFGVPLWKLPQVLTELDGFDGANAGAAAEATDENERVCGLIAAVEYYIACLGPTALTITANDGPKTKTAVMFRTDFASMYNTLSDPEKLAFRTWAGTHALRHSYMMPKGQSSLPKLAPYTRSAMDRARLGLEVGPTIAQWLDSISAPGADGKDRMSPPPNFPRHTTPPTQQIPYGMGLMGVDTTNNHVIAEFRDLGGANSYRALFVLAFGFAAARGLDGPPAWIEGDAGWAPAGPAVVQVLGPTAAYTVLPSGS